MHQNDNIVPVLLKLQSQSITINISQSQKLITILHYLKQQQIILESIQQLILQDDRGQILQPQRRIQSIHKSRISNIRQIKIIYNQQQLQQRPTNQNNNYRQTFKFEDDVFRQICRCVYNNQQKGLKDLKNRGDIEEKMFLLFEKMGVRMGLIQDQDKKKEKQKIDRMAELNKLLLQKLVNKQKQIKLTNQIIGKILEQKQQIDKIKQCIQANKGNISQQTLNNLTTLQSKIQKIKQPITQHNKTNPQIANTIEQNTQQNIQVTKQYQILLQEPIKD